MNALRDELRKLGRSQFKASSIAESERKQIQQLLEQTLTTLQQPQKDAFRELLEVVDGIEAAMQHTQDPQLDQAIAHAWQSGLHILHERMLSALKKWSITPIPAVGESFDPRYHQAVDVVHTSEVPSDTVIEEQRRGYLYQGDVLRYSEVVVTRRQEN